MFNGRPRPEETLIFKFREDPWSVHFKWLGNEGKGREVIYVANKDDKLHILTAAGDIPLTPPGRRLDLSRDNILVKAASKYPITEAGVCTAIVRFGRQIDERQVIGVTRVEVAMREHLDGHAGRAGAVETGRRGDI